MNLSTHTTHENVRRLLNGRLNNGLVLGTTGYTLAPGGRSPGPFSPGPFDNFLTNQRIDQIDPEAGTATPHDLQGAGTSWVEPTREGLIATTTAANLDADEYPSYTTLIDPETFTATKTVRSVGAPEGAGSAIVFTGNNYGREGHPVELYSASGRRLWKADAAGSDATTVGRRIYIAGYHCSARGGFYVRVLAKSSGRILARLKGRYRVDEPSRGEMRRRDLFDLSFTKEC